MMVDMIDDDVWASEGTHNQIEGDMPGVTLGEPSLKHGTYQYSMADCICGNDDPRYVQTGFKIPEQITVTLSGDGMEMLNELATAQGITPSEALRKAIATEGFLYEQRKKDATVLLLTASGEVREVLFR